MARLIIQIEGFPDRILELQQRPYRVGRAAQNDIVLSHPSVSSEHCILELQEEGLKVHDLGSTNGTEVDNQPVLEAFAVSGQVVRVGSVECRVEGVVPRVAIPKWEAAPPPELHLGEKPCANHPDRPASMECTKCHKVFCGACIHLMRRQGGVLHKLCPVCSHRCVSIEGMNQEARDGKLMGMLKRMIPKGGTMRLYGGGRRRKR